MEIAGIVELPQVIEASKEEVKNIPIVDNIKKLWKIM
jgi:hypothetical protein